MLKHRTSSVCSKKRAMPTLKRMLHISAKRRVRSGVRPYSEEAIRTLAQVLAGPERSLYHAESSSQKGKFYTLEVVGVDITCDCPGFTHRGSCRHVRPLKSALVAGEPLPKGYKEVTAG